MKVILFLAALLLTAAGDPLPIGAELPRADLAVKDVSGKMVSLAESMGTGGLLVMFSCNTCPYVIRNQQRTQAICQYARSHGLGVILLNSNEGGRDDGDSYEDMQQYAQGQHYAWYYALDKNNILADAFGADRTPQCFLFNAQRKLVYQGAIDDNPSNASHVTRQHLKMAIDEMLSGKEISLKTSRSVGCGIKRL